MRMFVRGLLASVAAAVLCSTANATVLTFDIDNFPSGTQPPSSTPIETNFQAYGDNVNGTLQSNVGGYNFNYAMGNAFTPNLTVGYSHGTGATGALYYTDGPSATTPFWTDVAFLLGGAPSPTRSYNFTFTPDAGYGVRVNSFEVFRWLNNENQSIQWTLYANTVGGTVLDSGVSGLFNTTIGSPYIATTSGGIHYGTVVLEVQHLAGSGSGFALDNLNFDQVAPVPEPSTAATLLIGGAALISQLRRRMRRMGDEG